ncbi:MAG: hypothetical protein KDA32_00410 [Phycisphaerales bacterium]|nr:hypothetical protein [Phycisphaerales bacterium]
MRVGFVIRIGVFIVAAGVAAALGDIPVTFTRIVQTGDTIPGTTETYFDLKRPAASGDKIAWVGSGATVDGVFGRFGGMDRVIARDGTPIPGGTGTFLSGSFTFSLAKLDGNDVAFRATGAGGQQGIYATFDNGPLFRVVDKTTTIPGTALQYNNLMQPYLSNEEIAFSNDLFGDRAVTTFYSGGVLSQVWRANVTPLPSPMSGALTWVSQAVQSNGSIAMQAFDEDLRQAIITNRNGSVELVANAYELVPDSTQHFLQFLDPAIFDDKIAFIAWGDATADRIRGVYESFDGALHKVADTNTIAPGGLDPFVDFGRGPSHDGDTVVFVGGSGGGLDGLYVRYQGQLDRIIDNTQMLDGKQLLSVDIDQKSLFASNKVAFLAKFTDTSIGLYVAEFGDPPCPGDFDGSGGIDLSDLAQLLAHFGTTAEPAEGDLTGDGFVDLADLSGFLAVFGTSCV